MNERNITTEESLVLCKKLDKFEKTFMNLSDDITNMIKTINEQNKVIQIINLRYEFILDHILREKEEK